MTCIESNTPIQRDISNYKLEKLDEAFLFIISLIGLLITIIQVYYHEITGLVEIIPLLILGVGLPFYVGFIRGAISNSIIERLRGWIYLIVGVSAYGAFLMLTSISGSWAFLFFFFGIIVFASIEYTEKWFKNTFNFEETAQNMFALSVTVASSILLAYAFVFVAVAGLGNQSQLVISFSALSGAFLFILITEKLSRQVQSANLPELGKIENRVNNLGFRLPKWGKFPFLIAYLAAVLVAFGIGQAIFNSEITLKSKKIKAQYLFAVFFTFLLLSFIFAQMHLPENNLVIPFVSAFIALGVALVPFLASKTIDFQKLYDVAVSN